MRNNKPQREYKQNESDGDSISSSIALLWEKVYIFIFTDIVNSCYRAMVAWTRIRCFSVSETNFKVQNKINFVQQIFCVSGVQSRVKANFWKTEYLHFAQNNWFNWKRTELIMNLWYWIVLHSISIDLCLHRKHRYEFAVISLLIFFRYRKLWMSIHVMSLCFPIDSVRLNF